jgi:hypothetical protein
MGQTYDEVLRLKEFRRAARLQNRSSVTTGGSGGVDVVGAVGALCMAGTDGGALPGVVVDVAGGSSPSLALIDAFYSFIASSSFPDPVDTFSLPLFESDIFALSLRASGPLPSPVFRSFDLSKAPCSYSEAMARPDASVWRAAMDRERQSLVDMGAFEEAVLPPGAKAVGLKWVYDFKTDALGC